MIAHRVAAALAGAALIAGLSGCASPAFDEAAAAQLQESVVAVAGSAAAGDLPGAVAGLDELQTELDAAVSADLVTAARAARIQTAINAVRSDLESLQAPAVVETPAPVEPTAPVDTAGDDGGQGDDKGGGGGNENSGPGNNNGNGNGNGNKGNGKNR